MIEIPSLIMVWLVVASMYVVPVVVAAWIVIRLYGYWKERR